ncbi:MAG TPA: MFS transporter [Caldilineae bacterium]|nr:MFS transporter [Caldilineae bacterium]
MSSSSRLAEYRTVLGLPGFRWLWLSQLLALTAQNGIHLVQVVLIERLTGSSVHIGLMVASFSLPPVIFSFLAGVVVDRVPKKWIIVTSNFLRGSLALSYIFMMNWLSGDALLVVVYVITFLSSSIGAFFNPAVLAKLPLVVGEKRLLVANSLFNLTVAGAQLIGLIVIAPVAVKIFKIQGAFALMGALYLVAFVMVLRLPRDPARRIRGVTASSGWRRMVGEVRDGWAFVVTHRAVALAILQLTLVATLLMILAVIAPGFSARILGLSPEDAVLVFAPAGVGMLLALVFLGRYATRFPPAWLQPLMLLLTGASFALMAFISQDYYTYFIPILEVYPQRLASLSTWVAVSAIPMGFGLYAVNTIAQTAIQHLTPASLRGRVFTVQFMLASLVGLIPLMAAATLADMIGIPGLLRWLAASCLLVAILSIYSIFHPIRADDRPMP